MLTGLLAIGAILLAMGWFAIGWIARGQENRKYAESRLRALAAQSVAQQIEQTTWVDAQRLPADPAPAAGQPVIHVHMPSTLAAPMWPQPPVITSRPSRELDLWDTDEETPWN